MKEPQAGRQRTKGKDFTVGSFSWSPDGSKIAFSAAINPDLINGATSDIYVLNPADDLVKKTVAQPGPDSSPHWSPDGKQILFSTYMGNPKYNANDSRLALVPADGGTIRSLTDSFDENPGYVAWRNDGIYFSALQKTASHLFHLDPATLMITRITSPDSLMAGSFSFTRDGKRMAFSAASPTSLNEICVSDFPLAPRPLEGDPVKGSSSKSVCAASVPPVSSLFPLTVAFLKVCYIMT